MGRVVGVRMTRKSYLGLTLAAALFAALPGFAEPTAPSANTGAECTSVTGAVVNSFTSCSAGGGVAQVTLAPFAGVSSSATAGAFMASGGFTGLIYDFVVVGGRVGDVVPLVTVILAIRRSRSLRWWSSWL